MFTLKTALKEFVALSFWTRVSAITAHPPPSLLFRFFACFGPLRKFSPTGRSVAPPH
jgi:hypothetical protein